jgi:hypothetical protein
MDESQSGYRGKWVKWALIYLVAGAIVYFIVYLVFFHHGGGYGGGGGSGGNGGGYMFMPLLVGEGTRRVRRRAGRA